MADVCVFPLHTMWPPGYSTSILHVFIICEAFTSKVLLHFWKQEKVRRVHVQTVLRMLEGVPMDLLTQQDLCLQGSMQTCIVVQQNNSTREIDSSIRWPKISSASRKRIKPGTSQSAGFSIGKAVATALSALTTWQDPIRRTTAWGNFQHHTEHQKPIVGWNKIGARTVCANVLYFLDVLRISILIINSYWKNLHFIKLF